MKPKLTLPERERLLKRVLAGEPVSSLCREAGISRVLIYRWLHRYKDSVQFKNLKDRETQAKLMTTAVSPKKGEIAERPHYPVTIRIRAIESVLSQNKSITQVCRDFNISKTIFYRWLNRYKQAGQTGERLQVDTRKQALPETTEPRLFDENKAVAALEDRKPFIEKYPNQVSDEYEDLILDAAAHYPELSSHKLVDMLPMVGNRPVVGNHGVQNVLRRHNLTTYLERFAYAQTKTKTPPAVATFKLLLSFLQYIFRLPFKTRNRLLQIIGFTAIPFTGAIFLLGFINYIRMFANAPSLLAGAGYFVSSLALLFGLFFFLYSLKYYLSVILVLGYSRYALTKEGTKITSLPGAATTTPGLLPDLSGVELSRHPFVSVHLPLYNEKRVVNRLLEAATSINYDNFEVIVCDDSTDETKDIVMEWKNHPRVKILHRDNRIGYKGAALSQAVKVMDPRTEFVLVFDADFIPFPDAIEQFLKYGQVTYTSLDKKIYSKSKVAAFQGYQWHVLNKSENWITRGVRTEYAGSYIIERSGEEIYGGIKQIAGSVYLIRADILKRFGWGTSITEDFELTLRLYADGYKVVYTPYIQAPSECVSTIKRLIRQRMRWAEGHSFNIKKMFRHLLLSPHATLAEKMEFLYLSPYYLQSFFFLLGTLFWFAAEVVFHARLPFWTEVWGWSLVLTNLFSLPLMNIVGLFLEEAEEKDYLGIFSFVGLTYIVTPFQAYASVKGFLEKEEGPWFRTPKTGRITDTFRRGKFVAWFNWIFGKPQVAKLTANNFVAPAYLYGTCDTSSMYSQQNKLTQWSSRQLSLVHSAWARNDNGDFRLSNHRKGRVRRGMLALFLILVLLLGHLSPMTFMMDVGTARAVSEEYLDPKA
ncbi:MAG: Glycosyl transferase family 2 [Candidatus Nomurabacteria bacterium GW2011_GWB1_37_5]|uniref:Glycosyl transferase family 2 n=1 Tax=Candidatus Nomurabacteria bacterium GW2011_GWB1_37_5 TaxID=1618742 RepID=A0A0G0GSD0_9BACT|nr:MAG: Glycosyl transferase family 2 [Candidatus Nomurabacteria bacterium GW2011_GWB1_37_5]